MAFVCTSTSANKIPALFPYRLCCISLGCGNDRHPMPCQYSAGDAVTIWLGPPGESHPQWNNKLRVELPRQGVVPEYSQPKARRPSMPGGVSSIYGTSPRGPKDVPVTGCVAAPTRLLSRHARSTKRFCQLSRSSYIHVPCLALPAGIPYEDATRSRYSQTPCSAYYVGASTPGKCRGGLSK